MGRKPKELLHFRVRRLVKTIARFVSGPEDSLAYWERRAREYGPRSVLHLGHAEHEFDEITAWQERELFPHFLSQLTAREKLIVDFGCGPGRFTRQLADMTGGRVLGIDPVMSLLALAPKHDRVTYLPLRSDVIPLPKASVDAIWCCLVLGGISGKRLTITAMEFDRVLASDGLLFLIENTSDKLSGKVWTFRSIANYCSLFPSIQLCHLHDYYDLGERISIIAGRKSHRSAAAG